MQIAQARGFIAPPGYSRHRPETTAREGQKVFMLRTLPAEPDEPRREVAESSGFSLHAGVAAKASQRDKLEHLARYVSGPPVATERLSLTRGKRSDAVAGGRVCSPGIKDAVSGWHRRRRAIS